MGSKITNRFVESQQDSLLPTNAGNSSESLAERLKARRRELGLSQVAIARDVSARRSKPFTQQAYASLETGNTKNSAELPAIADALGVTLEWLRDGVESQTVENSATHKTRAPALNELELDIVYEIDVNAIGETGDLTTIYQQHGKVSGDRGASGIIRGEWAIPEDVMHQLLRASAQYIQAYEVVGDSMEPRLFNGDRVFVDLRYTLPNPEGMFAIWDGLSVVVKRLQLIHGSEPKQVRIVSVNTSYSPRDAALDSIRIIGRYAGRFTVN